MYVCNYVYIGECKKHASRVTDPEEINLQNKLVSLLRSERVEQGCYPS